MSAWPQLSGNSNVFRQSYVAGFLDVSGAVTIREDLNIYGRLVVPTVVNNSVVTNYSLIIAEDISLNGRMYIGNGAGSRFLQGNAYMLDVSGTSEQTGTVRIFEDKGTLPTATTGSLILQHNDVSGVSSILFPSKSALGLDYASIAYYESISGGLSGGSKYNYYGASSSTQSSALVFNVQRDAFNATDVSSIDSIILQATGSIILDACNNSLGQTIIQPRGGNVGIGRTNPQYALDVTGVIRSNNLPKFWNSDRLAVSVTNTTTKYLLLGTLGDWNNGGSYGSINIKGSIGGWGSNNLANIDAMITTRGQPSSTPLITGIIQNYSTNSTTASDIVIYYTGTTGTTAGPQYYVYLVLSSGGTSNFVSFDLTVTGNSMNSNVVNLAEPTGAYTTTTPTGTLVTSSVCRAVANVMSIDYNGNVGIGTPIPVYDLDISGGFRTNGTINITNGASTGTISMNGAVLTTGNVLSLTNSATSTSTATGALQVTGGVGIGGNLNVGGALTWSQSAFISCNSTNVSMLVNATQTFTWTSAAGSLLGFSSVSANSTITIPYSGYYLITFSTYSTANGAVNSNCVFTITTTPETIEILRAGFPGVSSFTQTLTGTRMIKFTAGNTIVVTGINSTAGGIGIGTTNLQVVRLI